MEINPKNLLLLLYMPHSTFTSHTKSHTIDTYTNLSISNWMIYGIYRKPCHGQTFSESTLSDIVLAHKRKKRSDGRQGVWERKEGVGERGREVERVWSCSSENSNVPGQWICYVEWTINKFQYSSCELWTILHWVVADWKCVKLQSFSFCQLPPLLKFGIHWNKTVINVQWNMGYENL